MMTVNDFFDNLSQQNARYTGPFGFWKEEAMRSLDQASSIGLGSSDTEIQKECSIRDVAYLQRSGMKAMGPWFEAHADNASHELIYGLGERINMLIPSWAATYKAMISDYDPIENYRADEEESIASRTTTKTTTKTKAIGSDELVATDLIEGEGAGSAADNVRTLSRHGNIGVTTSQQMIQSEIELRKTKFWDLVFADLDRILTVPFYGRVGAAGPYKLTGAVVANPEESASEILAGLTVHGVTYSVVTPTYVADYVTDQLSDYVDLSQYKDVIDRLKIDEDRLNTYGGYISDNSAAIAKKQDIITSSTNLTAGDITLSGKLSASSATIRSVDAESITASDITLSGNINAAHVIAEGVNAQEIHAGDITAGGTITASEANAQSIKTSDLTSDDPEISTEKPVVEVMQGYSFERGYTSGPTYDINVTYAEAVKNGNKLTLSLAFKITRKSDDIDNYFPTVGEFAIPSSLLDRLVGANDNKLDARYVILLPNEGAFSPIPLVMTSRKEEGKVKILLALPYDITLNKLYYSRYEVTFLLSDNMAAQSV